MRSIKQISRTVLLVSASVLIAMSSPLIALADDTAPAAPSSTTTTPTSSDPAPTTSSSTPATAETPVSTPAPATTTTPTSTPTTTSSETTMVPPAPKTTYTYDAASGRWNSDRWAYDPISGSYKQTPTPVLVSPAPSPSTSAPTTQTTIDSTTTAAIANALDAVATSGDASVLRNTTAGGATSGNASSTATIINNVNSSLTSGSNQQAATFATDVMGDVNGDIMLQPMLLKAMLEAGASQPADQTTINSATNTGITNDLTLSAASGNATVAGNTNAGNATSGTANTVANVVNIVNSMVASNQSFVGTINIYGNLNGDILIAPDFIPQLLASNGSAPAPVGTASITSNDTQSIVNNIALAAQTGQSLVEGNTNAGSATTGNASTNTVIFNLTGHEIVASNSLLVFVNVLGRWVGVIIDAPAGTTAAAIGNGVTTNTVAPDLVINATNTTQLTNNINLASQSGNASVLGNTNAGSALTGNATASANVANISNSQIGTTGWFGILFINVFGNWYGSFGINTAAGNPIAAGSQQSTLGTKKTSPLRVIEFIPRSPVRTAVSVVQGPTVQSGMDGIQSDQPDVLAAHTTANTTSPSIESDDQFMVPVKAFDLPLLIGSLVLIGGSLVGMRKLL